MNKTISMILLAAFCLPAGLWADTDESRRSSEFSVDLLTDSLTGSAALGLLAASLLVPPQTGTDGLLADVNPFDRWSAASYSRPLDVSGTVLSCAMLTLPALPAAFFYSDWNSLAAYGVMYTEAFLLTHSTKNLLKSLTARKRPWAYFPGGGAEGRFESFPSGHTAYAFLGATFTAVTLAADFPNAAWRPAVSWGGFGLAVAVGILRVSSGEHFFSDVLAGAAIGAFWGWLVPTLHKSGSQSHNAQAKGERTSSSGIVIQPAIVPSGVGVRIRF